MFYATFAISIVYIGVRLWGILFGVYSHAPKVWKIGSSVGRAMVLAGITIYMLINLNSDFLFVSSDYFYSGKLWNDKFISSIMSLSLNVIIGVIMFVLTLISLYRFTKYLRLAMPHAMQFMLDVLYCFPGVHSKKLLVIDTETKFIARGMGKDLAEASGGKYVQLPKASDQAIASIAMDAINSVN